MKQSQNLGKELDSQLDDHDGDGVPDQTELDFKEASEPQPQPADRRPGRERIRHTHDRSNHEHAG